ncbi:MAG: RNA polymerase sigma factor [Planctomycetaceae bacterium]|nr:RNA polymerase sigma factor [Planctomycetaceae bacterium]
MQQDEQQSEICRRFIGGDSTAFSELYDQHAPAVLAFLRSRLTTMPDAEDVSQTIWDLVWSKRGKFDGAHFRGWVFRIAHNEVVNWRRKSNRQTASPLVEGDDVVQAESTSSSQRDDELAAMSECMKQLSERLLTVINRVKLDGDAPVDVADDIGTSRGQIDKDVHRAKAKLRACMETKLP